MTFTQRRASDAWPSRLSRAVVLLAAFSTPLFASFQDINWGARPSGMGGAFTAIADDTNASLYNPAGLVQVQWNEVSAAYSQLFSGLDLYAGQDSTHLDQSYLAYASRPIPHVGSLGLSWASFNTAHLYREDTVALSYARNVGDFVPSLDNSLAVGVNLKYLHRGITLDGYTTNDPVFAGGNDSSSGFTVDAGVLYKPEEGPLEGWRLGLSGQNLTQPDLGFGSVDRVSAMWRLGAAYQSHQMPWLVPALDLTRRDGITNVQGGIESWILQDTIGFRAGGNRQEATAGVSYYYAASKRIGFRLDYGISIPYYVDGTNGNHRLAMTLYF